MTIGTALKIVCNQRPSSLLRNGGIALSYVELRNPVIRIYADGWKKTIRLKGFDSPKKYFSSKQGVKHISFAIAHETIHQVLAKLEGEGASLNLDRVSGGGELV